MLQGQLHAAQVLAAALFTDPACRMARAEGAPCAGYGAGYM
jgi:hypothetical protein